MVAGGSMTTQRSLRRPPQRSQRNPSIPNTRCSHSAHPGASPRGRRANFRRRRAARSARVCAGGRGTTSGRHAEWAARTPLYRVWLARGEEPTRRAAPRSRWGRTVRRWCRGTQRTSGRGRWFRRPPPTTSRSRAAAVARNATAVRAHRGRRRGTRPRRAGCTLRRRHNGAVGSARVPRPTERGSGYARPAARAFPGPTTTPAATRRGGRRCRPLRRASTSRVRGRAVRNDRRRSDAQTKTPSRCRMWKWRFRKSEDPKR